MARKIGAMLFYNASQLLNVGAAIALSGDISTGLFLVAPAAATTKFVFGLADLKRPFISFPYYPGAGPNFVPVSNELQEVFGTAAGGPGNPLGPGFGATPAIPWGLAVIDVFAVYNVIAVALTSSTLQAYRTVYTNNGAIAPVQLASSATLPTAVQANPYVSKVSLAQPLAFETADTSDVAVELTLVAPTGSTANVYGLGFHVVACLE